MEKYRVKSFAELHDAPGHHRHDAGWIYRGHADPHMDGPSRHFNWIMSSFDYWAEGLTGMKRDIKEARG